MTISLKRRGFWDAYWAMKDCGFSERASEYAARVMDLDFGRPKDRAKEVVGALREKGACWLGLGKLNLGHHPEQDQPTLPFTSDGDFNPEGMFR